MSAYDALVEIASQGGDVEGRPVDEWDWHAIAVAQAAARRRVWAMPRCDVCGRPMTCGQPERHRLCGVAT